MVPPNETHNLQGQAGDGNVQDNSTGKTENRTKVKNVTTNSHNTTINFHGAGEALLILVLLAASVLLIWKPWKTPPIPIPIPSPALDITMLDRYREGQRFIGRVKAEQAGWLYVVCLGADGEPGLLFPNVLRQNAHLNAGETLELSALEIPSAKDGSPVSLTLAFPTHPNVSNLDEVRERVLFFLCDAEVQGLKPAQLPLESPRSSLLSAKLLDLSFLQKVAAGDQYSLHPDVIRPGVISQREFGYTLRREHAPREEKTPSEVGDQIPPPPPSVKLEEKTSDLPVHSPGKAKRVP